MAPPTFQLQVTRPDKLLRNAETKSRLSNHKERIKIDRRVKREKKGKAV